MPQFDALFLVRDTGDTDNLKEYARELIKNGFKVCLLPLATLAQTNLLADQQLKDRVIQLNQIPGVKTQMGNKPEEFGGGKGHRAKFLAHQEAKIIAEYFDVPLVITGVVARSQRNICAAFKNKKDHVPKIIGYYDSLTLNQQCLLFHKSSKLSLFEKAQNPELMFAEFKKDPYSAPFPLLLDELWVPLQVAKQSLAQLTCLPLNQIRVVNHPGSQVSATVYQQLINQRLSVRERLQAADKKVIFYAGGRDPANSTLYTDSFKAFMQGIKQCRQGEPMVIIGQHPASDGILEKSFEPAIRVIKTVKPQAPSVQPADLKEFTTEELVIAADIIVTWNSTVGSQAAYLLGKPVCFLEASQKPDLPFAVAAGLARQASNAEIFSLFLREAMTDKLNGQLNLNAFAEPTTPQVVQCIIEALKVKHSLNIIKIS